MPRYRGDDIPPVSDYAHWNEDAQAMWYAENRYDMEHAGEPLDDFDDDWYDDEEEDEGQDDGIDTREQDAADDHDYSTGTKGPFDD